MELNSMVCLSPLFKNIWIAWWFATSEQWLVIEGPKISRSSSETKQQKQNPFSLGILCEYSLASRYSIHSFLIPTSPSPCPQYLPNILLLLSSSLFPPSSSSPFLHLFIHFISFSPFLFAFFLSPLTLQTFINTYSMTVTIAGPWLWELCTLKHR